MLKPRCYGRMTNILHKKGQKMILLKLCNTEYGFPELSITDVDTNSRISITMLSSEEIRNMKIALVNIVHVLSVEEEIIKEKENREKVCH